jgi:hypothetical protein
MRGQDKYSLRLTGCVTYDLNCAKVSVMASGRSLPADLESSGPLGEFIAAQAHLFLPTSKWEGAHANSSDTFNFTMRA